MVKLEDGSLVYASQLIGGAAEGDDGKPIKFEENRDSTIPTYRAERDLNDGTGRKKIYSFDIADVQCRVSVSVVEASQVQQQEADKDKEDKQNKESSPSHGTEARVVTTKVPNK